VRRLVRRRPAVPTANVAELRSIAHRTTVLRLALAVLLLALLLFEVRAARDLRETQSGFYPRGTSAVIVVDLSLSIVRDTYPTIGAIFRDVISHDAPAGLVIFSDSPYELLPPGSPGRDLKPFLRYFTPIPGKIEGGQPVFQDNPWAQTFRAGTRISGGLQLARDMLRRDHVKHGSIVLASDLSTPGGDVPAMTGTLLELKRDGIPLKIVPLFASPGDRAFFERLVGPDAFDDQVTFAGQMRRNARETVGGQMPWTLLVIGALLIVVVGANERLLARLPLPRRRTKEAVA
jgi:hypothetical protein